jgi:rhomboid family protein
VIIPIGHDHLIRRFPWVTSAIIAVCTLVQLYSTVVAPSALDFEYPTRKMLEDIPILRFGYWTGSGVNEHLITSQFVHAGWLHLIGNMLFLFVAGTALEDRWGHVRFLVFYLVGGAVAALAFDATYTGDSIPLVGASGAIAALMGAFLVLFSKTNIRLWYWMFMRTGTLMWPAYVALPLWLAMQIVWAKLDDLAGAKSIAYEAHIGGFLFGVVIALIAWVIFDRRSEAAAEPVPAPSRDANPRERVEQRVQQCRDAIRARDVGQLRVLASRTILDLARLGDNARILGIYRELVDTLSKVPFTDAAFAAVAAAADATGDTSLLWRLAEHERDVGRVDLAIATLEGLAQHFPHDAFGARAAEALQSRPP